MARKVIKIGQIVEVHEDDGSFRLARVIEVDHKLDVVMINYLDDYLNDLEMATVSSTKVKIFEGKIRL